MCAQLRPLVVVSCLICCHPWRLHALNALQPLRLALCQSASAGTKLQRSLSLLVYAAGASSFSSQQ